MCWCVVVCTHSLLSFPVLLHLPQARNYPTFKLDPPLSDSEDSSEEVMATGVDGKGVHLPLDLFLSSSTSDSGENLFTSLVVEFSHVPDSESAVFGCLYPVCCKHCEVMACSECSF